MMNRTTWESAFQQQLKAQLHITPEQVNFRWQMYPNQRYTPEQAITHLVEVDRLLPERRVLPAMARTEVA